MDKRRRKISLLATEDAHFAALALGRMPVPVGAAGVV